ncbi:APC family permease [Humibacillus sp. DSM 29435]|uniref:APC family permease n=1 Tax=Humibacillus sp. DSM 29435 TaxID=1869167 RepID=UPI000A8F7F12|nr:APC family permease [Humibacillus sp. DSM 29435]
MTEPTKHPAEHRLMSPDTELKRALGLPALALFGLVYLVPLTVFTTYGIVTEQTGGRLPTSYVFTLAAMIFTAFSYSAMVRAYPVSGSAYTYTSRSFGGHAGFLAGWSLLLDYLFLPMINYLVIGIYLNAQFPAVPIGVFALVAIVLVTVLNVVGITTIANVNVAIIAAQAVFIVLFVALAIKTISGQPVDLLAPFTGDGSVAGLGPVLGGAAVLALSFLGFDAVSTLAEEAKDPRRDIPRAIIMVTLGGGILFIILSWLAQAALPATTFDDVDSAALDVMAKVGGQLMSTFFVAAYVAGAFGSALTSQASVTRIMYAMGRDGVFPRALGSLHPRFRTPVLAIAIVSVVSLAAELISLTTLANLISFGALVAFSAVNLSVVRHYIGKKRLRGGRAVVRYLVMPLVGFALTLWLWTSLSSTALWSGLIWFGLGVIWLAVLTKGFRRPPPTVEFTE